MGKENFRGLVRLRKETLHGPDSGELANKSTNTQKNTFCMVINREETINSRISAKSQQNCSKLLLPVNKKMTNTIRTALNPNRSSLLLVFFIRNISVRNFKKIPPIER